MIDFPIAANRFNYNWPTIADILYLSSIVLIKNILTVIFFHKLLYWIFMYFYFTNIVHNCNLYLVYKKPDNFIVYQQLSSKIP